VAPAADRGRLFEDNYCNYCAVPCFAGSYNEIHGSDACLPCPQGTYQEQPASAECVDCPVGKTSNITGASSVDQCVDNVSAKQGQFIIEPLPVAVLGKNIGGGRLAPHLLGSSNG